MAVWKGLLAGILYVLLLLNVLVELGAPPDVKAAICALIGAAVLFLGFIPDHHSWLNGRLTYFIRVIGAYSALLTGWFWLDVEGRDVGQSLYIALSVIGIILAVLVTQVILQFFPPRDQNHQ